VCPLFVSTDVLTSFVRRYFLVKFSNQEKESNIEITRGSFSFVIATIS